MLKIVPENTTIDFLKFRKACAVLSLVLLIGTISVLAVKGLNYGIDFAGGTLVQIQTEKTPGAAGLRESLAAAGYEGLAIQEYGAPDEYLIRLPGEKKEGESSNLIAQEMAQALASIAGEVSVRRVEYVGPQIGDELREKGLIALLLSMGAILFYISIRFELRYGVGAVVALLHDVLLTVGAFALLQKEVSLPVLAALLTVIGYSLNDTIVVFDRVRENRHKFTKIGLIEVLNLSINDMLNRTLMTSLTTLVVLLALFFLGGSVIHDFAFTLMFGVIVGTYSSIFIASPVVLYMEKYYKDKPEDDTPEPTKVG